MGLAPRPEDLVSMVVRKVTGTGLLPYLFLSQRRMNPHTEFAVLVSVLLSQLSSVSASILFSLENIQPLTPRTDVLI